MAKWGFILAVFAAFVILGCESSSKFDELFKPSWAFDHFAYDNAGEVINMKLDNYSGAGFASKNKYFDRDWISLSRSNELFDEETEDKRRSRALPVDRVGAKR